jgi:hypothetical protein
MLVSKPLIIVDRIHVSLLQVAWLIYMQTFTIGNLQMPIKKMNVYVGCSCPIMGIDSFGMHTLNLLHGVTSIIQLECCMLQIILLLLCSHK